MDRLEAIVEQMESGKMQLEELIVRYEEGMKLVKTCQERLASAEQRIEIITKNHAGQPIVQPFEPTASTARTAAPPEKTETENNYTAAIYESWLKNSSADTKSPDA